MSKLHKDLNYIVFSSLDFHFLFMWNHAGNKKTEIGMKVYVRGWRLPTKVSH